jgi:hypothetical protein
VRCEAAERELSARMDGAPDSTLDRQLSEHLSSCVQCSDFAQAATAIREGLRLEVADEVPEHLLAGIMQRLEQTAGAGTKSRRAPRERRRLQLQSWRTAGSFAAAFLSGALAAAVAVGGLLPRGPQAVLAAEIPGRIAEASKEITAYTATLRITELNFRPEVPVRRFETLVTFRAPEQFWAVTRDLTDYPFPGWPANNLTLEVDRDRWRLEAPRTCPRQALPTCPSAGQEVREVRGREPFDADTILPTDIILPLRTLAGADRVDVVGTARLAGRDVVQVRMRYRDAQPLFAFLHAGGSWRPYYSSDPVILSLDRETWFPVAYEVRAEDTPERRDWAQSQGLNDEAGSKVFEAAFEGLRFSAADSRKGPAGKDPAARDGGFLDLDGESLESRAGYRPASPAELAGLTPYRSGVFRDETRRGEVLLSFTRGLGWIKIRQTPHWENPALFGNVGPLASPVRIPGGGTGYYEPATDTLGRRLSIHAEDLDLYLETNLPPEELLRVAGSLPVKGVPVPPEWSFREWPGGILREQITLEQAVERIPYLRVPKRLPEGYQVTAVHRVEAAGSEGVTLFLRRPGMEADGVGIRVHQAPGDTLPPPTDPEASRVPLGDLTARYSPGRGELEWLDDGIYRSISGGGLDLGSLVAMGLSIVVPDLGGGR